VGVSVLAALTWPDFATVDPMYPPMSMEQMVSEGVLSLFDEVHKDI
jgi:hypothetical protein